MKVLVSYDSKFGNTERLAHAMAAALSPGNEVTLRRITEASLHLGGYDLVLLGGPTQGHGASEPLKAALHALAPGSARDVPVALFDTRFRMARVLTGSAAAAAGKLLKRSGRIAPAPEESFFVSRGGEPQLEDGELERAAAWAAAVAAALENGCAKG